MVMLSDRTKLVLAVLALACRTTDNGLPGSVGGPAAEAACRLEAEAFCLKRTNCWALGEHDFRFQRDWGTVPDCVDTRNRICLDDALRMDTAQTTSRIESCAKALQTQTCQDFLAGVALPGSACPPLGVGTVLNSAACVASNQCRSNYCDRTAVDVCGKCADRLGIGRACDQNSDCASGLTCQTDMVEGTTRCATPQPSPAMAKLGEPCGAVGMPACGTGMACVGPAMAGTCQPLITAEGAACDASRRLASDCDPERNLACNRTTKICEQREFVRVGEPCNLRPDGSIALCAGGARCVRPVDPATGQRPAAGTCTAGAAENAPCFTAAADGPACSVPLRCVLDAPAATTGRCLPNDYWRCAR